MLKLAIIIGSTRPNRVGEVVGKWVHQVALSLHTDFEKFTIFKPASYHEKSLNQMFEQLVAWGGAMKTLRKG